MSRTRSGRSRRFPAPLVAAAAALLALCLAPTAPAAAEPAAPPATPAPPTTQVPQSYFTVDGDTGAVVAAVNEHVPHLTASTIKVLTALVTLEQLPMTARLTVSRLAAAQPAMRIDMKEGSTWPLDQALASLMMVSANDAAYAMAENAGGDLPGFAAKANATAKRLGMKETTFNDPAGLDGAQGFGGGSMSSAYDLAIAARNALAVPQIADDAAKVTFEFTDPAGVGRRLVNHNKGFLTTYPGAIGLKTGFTRAASRTLLAAARRDGHTCIASVMGTWDDTGWAGYLLDQCFAGVRVVGPPLIPPVRFHPAKATATSALATSTTTVAPVAVVGAARTATPTPDTAAATTGAARAPAGATTSSGGGIDWWAIVRIAGLTLLGILAIAFVLRRRAVKRRKARRIERQRALAEARRRRMIDIVEPDQESDVRVVPTRTSHHVAATSRRRASDRKVVRPSRPRDHSGDRGHS